MKFLLIFSVFVIFGNLNSFTIDCTYETFTFTIIRKVYNCDISIISYISGIEVTNVSGKHFKDKNNLDVTSVSIHGNRSLLFFPRNISNFFPNIKAVTVYQAAIEILFGDEFDEFSQLESLLFYESNLTTISSKLFEKTPKIIAIYFANNLIEKVGRDLFKPLNVTQLQDVDFSNNRCISQEAQNQNKINSLVNDLQILCPFDDEFPAPKTCIYWDRKSRSRKTKYKCNDEI